MGYDSMGQGCRPPPNQGVHFVLIALFLGDVAIWYHGAHGQIALFQHVFSSPFRGSGEKN